MQKKSHTYPLGLVWGKVKYGKFLCYEIYNLLIPMYINASLIWSR